MTVQVPPSSSRVHLGQPRAVDTVTPQAPGTPAGLAQQGSVRGEPAAPRAPAEAHVVASTRHRAGAAEAQVRARLGAAGGEDAQALAAARPRLDGPRESARRLDASNIARRDNFQPSMDNTVAVSDGYERSPDAPAGEAIVATRDDTPAAACGPTVRCPGELPAATPTVGVAPSAPARGGSLTNGMRTLQASNVARRDNFSVPAGSPAGRPNAAGFEPATEPANRTR